MTTNDPTCLLCEHLVASQCSHGVHCKLGKFSFYKKGIDSNYCHWKCPITTKRMVEQMRKKRELHDQGSAVGEGSL